MTYFIFGNYGDNTIAVIQFAFIQQLNDVTVINIDTGWGASAWEERVEKGKQLAKGYGFKTMTLRSSHDFEQLVIDRNSFPSAKYKWCTLFLKALPFLRWLDTIDERCEGTIVLGSRREESRARVNLAEFIEESEHYGDRRVWYPLFNTALKERDALIIQSGLEVLHHSSRECDPCIHSSLGDIHKLDREKIDRITKLEQKIGQPMFHPNYPDQTLQNLLLSSMKESPRAQASTSPEAFDAGCGSWYACGDY
jgi:3'-phosphoadenosine 5'-phosphosulfate sulfotransferase (PAPS reductase)/FAD synthetase